MINDTELPIACGLVLGSDETNPRAIGIIEAIRSSNRFELSWIAVRAKDDEGHECGIADKVAARFLAWDRRLRASHIEGGAVGRCLGERYPQVPIVSVSEVAADGVVAGHSSVTVLIVADGRSEPEQFEGYSFLWLLQDQYGRAGSDLEGFSAVAARRPTSQVELREYRSGEQGYRVLGVAECRTHPVSPVLNRLALQNVSVRLFLDALECWPSERTRSGTPEPRGRPRKVARAVENGVTAGQVVRTISRAFFQAVHARVARSDHRVQWAVAVGAVDDCDWKTGRFDNLVWMTASSNGFVADPCLVEHRGEVLMFGEVLRYVDNRGYIGVMDARDPESWKAPQSVLVKPFHLSFPFVVAHDGEFFMLPEQTESGSVVLYRAHAFPFDWRPHATLLEGVRGADPVLLQHHGYWYLFVSRAEHGSNDDNLQLYFSASIDGPYRRHPASPVRESLLGSRMAGRIFLDGSRLIRPAQDCRQDYGAALAFFEVVALSPEEFTERQVAYVPPSPGLVFGRGVHSYSAAGDRVAIDGFRYLP